MFGDNTPYSTSGKKHENVRTYIFDAEHEKIKFWKERNGVHSNGCHVS